MRHDELLGTDGTENEGKDGSEADDAECGEGGETLAGEDGSEGADRGESWGRWCSGRGTSCGNWRGIICCGGRCG